LTKEKSSLADNIQETTFHAVVLEPWEDKIIWGAEEEEEQTFQTYCIA
jgi:hypothetical protein